jgi:hypothetical protein
MAPTPNKLLRLVLTKRNFYTINASKPESQVKLDDGSTLTFTKKQQNVSTLPPRLKNYPKTSIITKEQITEIKQLRESDPDTNTVDRLAKRYNTFPGFIMRHTQCPKERRERLEQAAELEFNGLTLTKKKTLIDRMRRKALW